MLYLSRKVGESIVVNNNVVITVTEVKGHSVKLGLSFSAEVSVLRKEVYDRISEENAAAISLDIDVLEEGLFDA